MFKKNYLFLRSFSIFYLLTSLFLTSIFYYLLVEIFREMINDPTGNNNIFKSLGRSWYLIPTFMIVNGITSPFFVTSIYLHFKYTNNRTYLKYTWFCFYNSLLEDIFFVRLIFIIIFTFKIWSKKALDINKDPNTNYQHIVNRSIFNLCFIIFTCIYFITFSLLKNNDAVGYGSMCLVFYGLIPKLVMNSWIDIKFSKLNLSNKEITLLLTALFFGIFPYCNHLMKEKNQIRFKH